MNLSLKVLAAGTETKLSRVYSVLRTSLRDGFAACALLGGESSLKPQVRVAKHSLKNTLQYDT
jgi:hypothetical protein